jgi:glutaconate CoA-transferase, subunit A
VTLFHAAKADQHGNVWIGIRRELMLMAHASKQAVVTAEEIVEGNLLDDPALAAGTIPALYISAIAVARRGAAPVGLAGTYAPDRAALAAYAQAAKTSEGFEAWRAAHDREAQPA